MDPSQHKGTLVIWPKTVPEFSHWLTEAEASESCRNLRAYCDRKWRRRIAGSEYEEPDDLFCRTIQRLFNSKSKKQFLTPADGLRYSKRISSNLLVDDARKVRRYEKQLSNPAEQVVEKSPQGGIDANLLAESVSAFRTLLVLAKGMLSNLQYAELYSRASENLPAEILDAIFAHLPSCDVANMPDTRRQHARRAKQQLETHVPTEMEVVAKLYPLVFKKGRPRNA